MKRVLVEDDNQRLPVYLDKIGESLWVHFKGQTFSVQLTESKLKRARGPEHAENPDILAPMPGKVTQVLCKPGDRVTKGQILVVMEAMKMEYNLKANKDGFVEAIDAQVLQQVELGQVLVQVKVQP